MPRNEPRPVSEAEAAHARTMVNRLRGVQREVTLIYEKRPAADGTVVVSSSTGRVSHFNGREGMDTHSVTINTEDKGARTINLHRIKTVKM